jgi:hypothetical protein
MATAYRCHLECPVEKPLVFAHSPYQTEASNLWFGTDNEYSYTFSGENIFYLRKTARADLYRNSIRLKINMPVSLEKQEIWHYSEPPVFFDGFLQPYYPFKFPLVREIEAGRYEAKYKVSDDNGRDRNVVFADEIDTQEEAENRLEYDGGTFSYSHYDVVTNPDRAILTLKKENDGDLYKAAIFGRPIVLDLNRSSFFFFFEAAAMYGLAVLNITGSYFSDYEIKNKQGLRIPHYEDWVIRELAERLQHRQEFTVKTHRALFNARVRSKVKIKTKNEESEGVINAFSFSYRKDEAFVATFKILQHGGYTE